MVGGIKASSPGMKSMSADMFLDLPTMSAPSGEERKLRASAQVERAADARLELPTRNFHMWAVNAVEERGQLASGSG